MRNNEPLLNPSQRMWFATILVVAFLVMLLTSCSGCSPRPAPVMPTLEPWGIARLTIAVDGVEEGFCTVWKIDHGMAVTAGHCCESAEDIMKERKLEQQLDDLFKDLDGDEVPERAPMKPPVVTLTADGPMADKNVKFKILSDDDRNDVCVLQGDIKGTPIKLAAHDPEIGEKVWTEGFPKGVFLITDGYWSGMMSQDTVVASTGIWGGSSGSPVMNAKGEAVGLLVRYMPPMSNMTFMTPIEWLRANVESAMRMIYE